MKKIVVIEDNPDNRLLVRVMLEPLYEVVEYETGFAALEGLPKELPDVVLLDISLPEMDGGEVLRRLRADPTLRHLPVIALTAHAMAGDREKYLAAGFDDYVTKPIVDERVLLGAIDRLLSRVGQASRLPPERLTLIPDGASKAPGTAGGTPTPLTQQGSQPRPDPDNTIEAAVERLRGLGGNAFVAEMINLFLEYAQTKIAEARKANSVGDRTGVAKAIHPLRSSAGNVGAVRVQELAARLETAAGTEPITELTRLLNELEAGFAEIKPALEAERSKCA